MPRSRNIKPAIFKNEILGEADPLLTILFMGLWCLADKKGRLEDRPKRIKAEIFPYRDLPLFNGYLTELEQTGFIDRYKVDGQTIIQVLNFNKHQSPHKTEKESELPSNPVETSTTDITPLNNESVTVKESLIPDSLIPDSLPEDAASLLFNYWKKLMGKNANTKLTAERRSKLKTRLKNYPPKDIAIAIRNCSQSPHNMGNNDRNTLFNDIELICRNDTKLEYFRDQVGAGNHEEGPDIDERIADISWFKGEISTEEDDDKRH